MAIGVDPAAHLGAGVSLARSVSAAPLVRGTLFPCLQGVDNGLTLRKVNGLRRREPRLRVNVATRKRHRLRPVRWDGARPDDSPDASVDICGSGAGHIGWAGLAAGLGRRDTGLAMTPTASKLAPHESGTMIDRCTTAHPLTIPWP